MDSGDRREGIANCRERTEAWRRQVNTFKADPRVASRLMQRDEVLKELYGLERFGIKLGLANITDLLHRIGDPQSKFPAVHVTGSNGKGSVCAFTDSILRAAGHRTGLYTSPHLIRFNERIMVDGREISDDDVVSLYELVKPHAASMAAESKAKQPTFFEITTAMAFRYFAEKEVDLVVAEVGMGGGMDATNVVRPDVCVLTRISLEHTEHLGKTIARIAGEKAGILKPGVPVVTLDQEALGVVEKRAEELDCPITIVGRDFEFRRTSNGLAGQTVHCSGPPAMTVSTSMIGEHQAENVALALAAAAALESRGWEISETAKQEGVEKTRWPARFQLVREAPPVVIDGAHNPGGARSLVKTVQECFPGKRLVLVTGMLVDKDLETFADTLAPVAAHVVSTKPGSWRAFESQEVADAYKKRGMSVETVDAVPDAIRRGLSLASAERPLLIAGSLYLAGEALGLFQGVSV